MRRLLAFGFAIFLTGCGETPVAEIEIPPDWAWHGFGFQSSDFRVAVPANFEILPPKFQNLFVARAQTETFLVTSANGFAPDLTQKIAAENQSEFLAFELISISENQIRFRAKIEAEKPKLEFWQKIIALENSPNFLLGSCSFHPELDSDATCAQIISTFSPTPK